MYADATKDHAIINYMNEEIVLSNILSALRFDSSWIDLFEEECSKDYFAALESFVKSEYCANVVYPKPSDIFEAFKYCSLNDVKVVILGQDPYHGEGQAHGLSFSVKGEQRLPPSLQNIFKEIKKEYIEERNSNNLQDNPVQGGDLTYLAKQGVLLLNAVLTVRAGFACSHQGKGWETFTDAIIKKISDKNEHVVFVLWGGYARSKAVLIDARKHLILESPHPSPLSAHRGFFGNDHFKKTNEYLVQHDKEAIDWLS